MISLHVRFTDRWEEDPFIVRVTSSDEVTEIPPDLEALLISGADQAVHRNCRVSLLVDAEDVPLERLRSDRIIRLPEKMRHLSPGDVIRINPQAGEIWVMYRRQANSNSMLLTEQCNSNCIMCSQPPKRGDDSFLARAYLEAIPLMALETPKIGITGGEPTLLGELLFEIIRACRDHLPFTALHMLSNGRLFNYLSLCRRIQEIGHPDLMIGIPLYSDIPHRHDFVVQAQGAFDQTLRGIMNLERCGQRVEVRVVLHRETVDRLPALAMFLARNLPFVEHVALMGLENMGYVRMNMEAIWIDPADYQSKLVEAVRILDQGHMNVSIYNHQLCLLRRELWPFARKSISDWKNEYLEVCDHCAARHQCGGFFSSARLRRSEQIRPLSENELTGGLDLPIPPFHNF